MCLQHLLDRVQVVGFHKQTAPAPAPASTPTFTPTSTPTTLPTTSPTPTPECMSAQPVRAALELCGSDRVPPREGKRHWDASEKGGVCDGAHESKSDYAYGGLRAATRQACGSSPHLCPPYAKALRAARIQQPSWQRGKRRASERASAALPRGLGGAVVNRF
uniref:Uncharacterized protein n=1 Tax=Coccolithus braarudii TaxID=221442 RepID=A0A7S0LBD5_9EUKA|mmetsp:Transcript_31306/g.67291  ORF Transcript_31306/g.67291 Transcript_31306/m.67291 type:complete len:162 (+) Transcript_31306:319-804(+)